MLTIVVPVYRSQGTIGPLVESLQTELSSIVFDIVLVNDGSPDNSAVVCSSLAERYSNVSFVNLRRNFGEFNAVMCGLNYAKGEFTVIIDDDFQNPPSEILKLLNKAIEGGYAVVYTKYDEKKHAVYRNIGSRLVNLMTTILLGKPRDLYLSSFKLLTRDLVEEIIKYLGPYPYIDGLIFRVTRNIGTVTVQHDPRKDGVSNYTWRKLISLFLNILFCYSTVPIRIFMPIGVGLLGISTLLLIYFAGQWIVGPDPKAWQVVTATIMFVGGIQCTLLSVLGEYIGKSFMSQSGVPQYVIKTKKLSNFALESGTEQE